METELRDPQLGAVFSPDDTKRLIAAFNDAVADLTGSDGCRDINPHTLRRLVARKIISIAKSGEADPAVLKDAAASYIKANIRVQAEALAALERFLESR